MLLDCQRDGKAALNHDSAKVAEIPREGCCRPAPRHRNDDGVRKIESNRRIAIEKAHPKLELYGTRGL